MKPSAFILGLVLILNSHVWADSGTDLIGALLSDAIIVYDMQSSPPRNGFQPARQVKKVKERAQELFPAIVHMTGLVNAAIHEAGSKRRAQENDAVKRHDFLSFLLGKDVAGQLRAQQRNDDFREATRIFKEKYDLAKTYDQNVTYLINKGVEYANRPQPQPNPPMPSANNLYQEYNRRLIAACHAGNMPQVEGLVGQMKQSGIPMAPEAKAALDAFVKRLVDKEMDPVRQSLMRLR